jgi:RNA polymerase sigma-70 factor (ECF subfamily)
MRFAVTRFRDLPDPELVMGYKSSQDERYLSELFSRYAYLVLFLCNKYFSNPEDSKDTTMEVLAKIARELTKHEVEDFKSWLYVVTKNLCIDKLRSDKSLNVHFLDINEQDSKHFMQFPEIDRLIAVEDDNSLKQKEVLKEAVAALDSDQKECLTLFYYERKSYLEIMQLKKWDMDKVRSHLQNARRNLKIYLRKRGIYAENN